MERKENHFLFYTYFIAFLGLAYIVRGFLSPTEHHVMPLLQIISMIALPFLWKKILPAHKIFSGVLFLLFFVFMFELANLIPLIGILVSALIYNTTHVNLGLDWSFNILKPAFVLSILWLNRTSFLLFFNVLCAEKIFEVKNELDIKELPELQNENSKTYYIPQEVNFYVNELTQVVTILFNAPKKFLPQMISLSNEEYDYFFLNHKKDINPPAKSLTVTHGFITIDCKEYILAVDTKDFTQSLHNALEKVLEDQEAHYISSKDIDPKEIKSTEIKPIETHAENSGMNNEINIEAKSEEY